MLDHLVCLSTCHITTTVAKHIHTQLIYMYTLSISQLLYKIFLFLTSQFAPTSMFILRRW